MRDVDRNPTGAPDPAGWPPAGTGAPGSPITLVDAHVHFHGCFDLDSFLDAAARNFQGAAAELGLPAATPGCLLLAEMQGEQAFQRFRGEVGLERSGPWRFAATDEECSLVASRPDLPRSEAPPPLVLVAGRQIRTREGLEVLALATLENFSDGLPFAGTLERVHWSGALPVVPWGFGKWWFERGGLVESLLQGREREAVFLGDNAGRPGLAPRPPLFRLAESHGVPVLPGSDPLPLAEHAGRAGSYGFLWDAGLDGGDGGHATAPARPAAALVQALRQRRRTGWQPRVFGRCSGLLDFCRDQSALRLRGRLARLPALPKVAG